MAAEGIGFKQAEFKKPLFPGGPVFFDFDMLPEPDGKSIACVACHDPHGRATKENPTALRAGGVSGLCGTCHQDKWQNILLEGTAGAVSSYEYPGSSYRFANPHNTAGKCVLCHMDTAEEALDAQGNRAVGGHTMRMRSLGTAEALGGYGLRSDNPALMRGGEAAGNILNLAPCRRCHGGAVETFNYRGLQEEIFGLWMELGNLLREQNSGYLPGYRPGDKCATCHRGGTLPFENDPKLILENAYSNYKLIGSDRSWGIHNPRYVRQLLLDSIASLKNFR
jgi:predicted CXXCH cytochrome family protein